MVTREMKARGAFCQGGNETKFVSGFDRRGGQCANWTNVFMRVMGESCFAEDRM